MARAIRQKQRGKWWAGLAAISVSITAAGQAAENAKFGAAAVIESVPSGTVPSSATSNTKSSRRTNNLPKTSTPIATSSFSKPNKREGEAPAEPIDIANKIPVAPLKKTLPAIGPAPIQNAITSHGSAGASPSQNAMPIQNAMPSRIENAVAPIVSSANVPRPGSKSRENVIPDINIPALLPTAQKLPFAYPKTNTPDEPRLIKQTSGVEEEAKVATLGMPLLDAKQAPPLLLRKIEEEPAKLEEKHEPELQLAPIVEKSATKLPLAMWSAKKTEAANEKREGEAPAEQVDVANKIPVASSKKTLPAIGSAPIQNAITSHGSAGASPSQNATPIQNASPPAIKFVEAKPAPIIEKPAPITPSSTSDGFKVRLMDVRQVETVEEAENLLQPRPEVMPEQVASVPKIQQPTPLMKEEVKIAANNFSANELIEEVTPMVPTRAPRPAAQPIVHQPQPTPAQPKPEEIRPNVNDPRITRGLRDTPSEPLPAGSPFEVIEEQGKLTVMVRRSKLLRTQVDVYRTAVVDDGICEVVQFTPREVSIIGKSTGATHVTFWFEDANMKPLTYLVKVEPDTEEIRKLEQQYMVLEQMIAEMFPNSKIRLTVAANKLIVRGQARDSEEASQIMSLIRSQQQGVSGRGLGGGSGSLNEGIAAAVLTDSAQGSGQRANLQIINMIRVPGVQQVALRVKIAELNRTAARNFGVDVGANINVTNNSKGSQLFLNSLLNTANGATVPILGQFDGDDIKIGLNFLQEQGVVKLLAEPTLVTISGRPATFVAGGEFAVPTAVGVAGLSAVSTDFRAFGSIISFLPTIVDKDRIRLQVSPEFSQVNASLSVNNIPGLRTRTANTTVEMREGQTLAIAGLLEESMTGNTRGNLPFLARLFGKRSMSRSETELIILVTPELVHPMEPEEVPPLPGFDVMEPTNAEFFLHGSLEGNPTREYRSTVWPRLHKRYGSGGPSMTSGPFGHGQ